VQYKCPATSAFIFMHVWKWCSILRIALADCF